jgi:hypothetical protein
MHHLAGETVSVYADGFCVGDKVVSANGVVTLDDAASVVLIGYGYTARLRTMDIEGGAQNGISQGRVKRISDIVLRLNETGDGLEYGSDFVDMDMLELRDLDDLGATPVEPFSGDTERLPMQSENLREARLTLRHAKPYPCTVVGAFFTLNTEEGA